MSEKQKIARRRNRAKFLLLGGNLTSLKSYQDVLSKEEKYNLGRALRILSVTIEEWDENSKKIGLNPLKICPDCGIKMKTKECKLCKEAKEMID